MNIVVMENRMRDKEIDNDVLLAKRGDKEAYVRLMRQNKVSMYRVAKSILSVEEDVEDAVSEAILKGYISISKLKKDEYFKTWLIRILINECNAIYKKRKREVYIEKNHIELVKENDCKKDLDLYKAINLLDEDLRITTLLFYFEDMKYKDIAKALKIREGTVKSRLSRAKEKLHRLLKEDK
ncbi:MAG: sigma-70 family RNA polymerase sigma factor [Romboutsia sp.]|uniref:sigma-70 family RNA polymerase sigma factor n=1 Tax=Romboutsia sp. TaxID=1965302 RepID=UPI003F3ED77A